MPSSLQHLIDANRVWATRMEREQPGFFQSLAKQQSPKYLWIGCSDSRVPANQVTGLAPGEVFVHRNVANVVVSSDLNALSVIQFAVDVLKVEHIMVVGHYGCGGVLAVAERRSVGLADNWLRHVADIAFKHIDRLDRQGDKAELGRRLVELNVVEQVANVCRSTILREAWFRGQPVAVHGMVYGLDDGLLRPLGVAIDGSQDWEERHEASIQTLVSMNGNG